MKLIAIDMDGTLFSSSHTISQENIQAIQEATKQGHIVMICSGRPHNNLVEFIADEMGLILPVAGSNGAVSFVDNKILHTAPLDLEICRKIATFLEAEKHPYKFYTNKGVFIMDSFYERTEKELLQAPISKEPQFTVEMYTETMKKFEARTIKTFSELEEIEGLEIFKTYVSTPLSERKESVTLFLNSLENIGFTSSAFYNIEIMSIDGHKGTGLRRIAEHYKIPTENTIAIGDNFNDVPMMEIAGLAIAMDNAEEEIKEICDVVTKSNDENGVAYAIRKYVLNEES